MPNDQPLSQARLQAPGVGVNSPTIKAETKALGRPTKLAWAEVASWNASYAAVTKARDEISLFGDAKRVCYCTHRDTL